MKQIALILSLLMGFSFSAVAQSGKVRPRVIPESSPQPTTRKSPPSILTGVYSDSNSTSTTPKAKQPPILRGDNQTPNTPPTQNQTNQTNSQNIEDDGEVLRVDTELVTIPVAVFDRQGHFVSGLKQSDFKIFEDGKEQEIAYLNPVEQPFTVVLLLDVSNSTKFKIDEIQDAAIAFVEQLKENDRVMVVSFAEHINVLSEPTTDRNRLTSAIRRADFGGGTSLYDAVDFAINQRLNKIEGRKAIVLFTDGVDTTSRRSDYDRTLRDSEELEATIYTVYYNTYSAMQDQGGGTSRQPFPRRGGGGIGDIIGVILGGGNVQIGGGGSGGRGTSRAEYAKGERYVEDLAYKTGGRKYDADSTSSLETAFYNIAEELRRQYALGYYPTDAGKAGQRKQIKVRVNRPDVAVRARDSYIVNQ